MDKNKEEERSCYFCLHLDKPSTADPCKDCENYDRFEKYEHTNQTINEKLGILGE